MPTELRLEALRAAPDALSVAIGIVQSAKAAQDAAADPTSKPHAHVHSEMHTRWAVDTVLDRALGRAEQAIHVTGEDSPSLPGLDSAGLKRLLTAIAALEADEAAIDVTPAPDASVRP